MRKPLAYLLVAAAAAASFSLAPSASAVCGGGAPGEACYCPSEIDLVVKEIRTGINCFS